MDLYSFIPGSIQSGRKDRQRRHMDDDRVDDHGYDESRDLPEQPGRQSSGEGDTSATGETSGPWIMKMTQSAYHDMRDYLLAHEPEVAGLLLGPAKDDVLVTHFVPDSEGVGTPTSFSLNAPFLNQTLKQAKLAGLNAKGLAHLHPVGVPQPSYGDLAYLERLFRMPANAAAQQCFMPVVCDGRVYPYVYARGRLWVAELILV